MSIKTAIAWTDHTFNIAWGCTKVDPGCAHCYAATFSERVGYEIWGSNPRRTFGAKHWGEPLKWNRLSRADWGSRKLPGGRKPGVRGGLLPRLVFCSSMCDVFEDHPTIAAEREKLWPLIRNTPWLDWQILTKRADRIADNLPPDWGAGGYPNVWLGVSISEKGGAWRADSLRSIPAPVRFISYEPALGPLDDLDLGGIDWVIYGGESGPGFRGHDLNWPRAMREKCASAGVAFFYKQGAAPRTEMLTELDGEKIQKFPIPRPGGCLQTAGA